MMELELDRLAIVTRYELLKHFRRKRFYAVFAIVIAIELLILVIPKVLGEGYPDNVMTMAAMLSIGPSFAVIASIFFIGDAIAGEFEGKTGYILFSNPIKRTTVVAGKYLACFAATALILLALYGVTTASLLGIYHQVPLEVWESFAYCLLYVGGVLAMALFFSSILRGSMGAALSTFFLMFMIFPILQGVLMTTGHEPWFILTYAGGIVSGVYRAPAGMGPGQEALMRPEIGQSLVVMVIYLVAFLFLSAVITRRREMI